jgi:hypothetical protein
LSTAAGRFTLGGPFQCHTSEGGTREELDHRGSRRSPADRRVRRDRVGEPLLEHLPLGSHGEPVHRPRDRRQHLDLPGAEDKRCRAVSGKVKSCNGKYGQNGWLGVAQIWLSGGHIAQGTAKMNDTYFAMPQYNSPTKRQHVMCQEIGHDWGLGHQDESGADLNTCMDYSSQLDNPDPNSHDYQQLSTIYGSHLDSSNSAASVGLAGDESARPTRVERNDRIADSIITETYRDGSQKVTHVFWALETRGRAAEHAFGHDHE